jgi:hypothetical protein
MKFDFEASIDTVPLSEQGVRLELRNARGDVMASKGKPVAVIVLGPDSAKYRATIDEITRARLAEAQKAKETGVELKEEPNRFTIEVIAALTKSWENVHDQKGDSVPFTPENVKALYAYPVIRDQVDAFISKRANFLKASSTA